jgi:hypothetical protein
MYSSVDAGSTWIRGDSTKQPFSPYANWPRGSGERVAVASSADGNKLACIDAGLGYITPKVLTSINSGTDWTYQSLVDIHIGDGNAERTVASSADGSMVVVCGSSGISRSTDSGVTWSATGAPAGPWLSIVSSADGAILCATKENQVSPTVYNNQIWLSEDYGTTWVQQTSAGERWWKDLAMSADGKRIYAVEAGPGPVVYNSGHIWSGVYSQSPQAIPFTIQ